MGVMTRQCMAKQDLQYGPCSKQGTIIGPLTTKSSPRTASHTWAAAGGTFPSIVSVWTSPWQRVAYKASEASQFKYEWIWPRGDRERRGKLLTMPTLQPLHLKTFPFARRTRTHWCRYWPEPWRKRGNWSYWSDVGLIDQIPCQVPHQPHVLERLAHGPQEITAGRNRWAAATISIHDGRLIIGSFVGASGKKHFEVEEDCKDGPVDGCGVIGHHWSSSSW